MEFKITFGTKKDRLPIILIDLYIIITLLIYIFGPIKFKNDSMLKMLLYMLFFLFAINTTYFLSLYNIKYRAKVKSRKYSIEKNEKVLPFWFQIIGMIIPVFMILSSIATTGVVSSNGLFDTMAQSYAFVQGGGLSNTSFDIPMWIYMHFGIFVYLSIIDSLVYYKQLNIKRKLVFFITIVSLLGYFIFFKGTQKTLGDVFILVVSAFIIRQSIFTSKNKRSKKTMVLLIALALVFAYVLSSVMGGRIEYLNSVGYNAFRLNTDFYNVDLSSPFLIIFDDSSKLGICCLIFYLCNGLYGLSLCLNTSFTWSYGIGSMMDLTNIIEGRLNTNCITNSTYMYKTYLETGWSNTEYWHTIFPWLASDFTFLGAILILCVITYIYAICWFEIIHYHNKKSIFLFSIINIMWIYLPANNQIFSSRTTMIIFIICFVAWIRRNRNNDRKRIIIKK